MKTVGTVLGVILGILLLATVGAFLGAWGLMILIGNMHASLFPNLPAIGFWDSLSIAYPLAIVISYLNYEHEE